MKVKIDLVAGIVCVILLIRYMLIIRTGTHHTIFLHMSAVAATIGVIATLVSYLTALKHKK